MLTTKTLINMTQYHEYVIKPISISVVFESNLIFNVVFKKFEKCMFPKFSLFSILNNTNKVLRNLWISNSSES